MPSGTKRLYAALVLACLSLFNVAPARAENPVRAENALAGTPGWATFRPTAEIEGYSGQVSVEPGGSIAFHVAGGTRAPRYRIEVYRLGWYSGAGARRVGCLPDCFSDRATPARPPVPAPDSSGRAAAGWPVTDVLDVPVEWLSGYYEARIVVTAGEVSGTVHPIYFVVREPALRASTTLVQVPVNTWQAYNNWAGKSLYNFNSTGGARASRVSFDRPYELAPMPGAQATPLAWEIQLVRFLEREGYDVSYQTDVDTDRDAGSLMRHRLVMTAGHSEYWTKGMRDAFDAARDRGTNLAFVGSNNAYWQVRYEDDRRTLVGYKSRNDPIADPALKTMLFRDLGRPECALVGVMHLDSMGLTDYAVDRAAIGDPWFAGTGFTATSTLPFLVGLEYDAIPLVVPGECAHPDLTVFFRHDGPPGNAHAVRYVASSGARVFASGTMQFSWALDDFNVADHAFRPPDARVQAFMRNALDDLTRPAAPAALTATNGAAGVSIAVSLRPDSRIVETVVVRAEGRGFFAPSTETPVVCRASSCVDRGLPGHRTYRYAAVVRDRWGSSHPVFSAPVDVPNTRPQLRLAGPARTVPGRPLRFRANASDRDGDELTYRWRVDGAPVPASGAELVLRFRRRGLHRVSAEVRDGHGGLVRAQRLVRLGRS